MSILIFFFQREKNHKSSSHAYTNCFKKNKGVQVTSFMHSFSRIHARMDFEILLWHLQIRHRQRESEIIICRDQIEIENKMINFIFVIPLNKRSFVKPSFFLFIFIVCYAQPCKLWWIDRDAFISCLSRCSRFWCARTHSLSFSDRNVLKNYMIHASSHVVHVHNFKVNSFLFRTWVQVHFVRTCAQHGFDENKKTHQNS